MNREHKTRGRRGWRIFSAVLCLAGLLVLAACWGGEEPPSIWENRVGAFTLDEAEQLYGPATACQDMSGGDRVCAWFVSGRSGWSDRAILIFDEGGVLKSVEREGTLGQ